MSEIKGAPPLSRPGKSQVRSWAGHVEKTLGPGPQWLQHQGPVVFERAGAVAYVARWTNTYTILFLESEHESCVTAAAGAWLDVAQPSATRSRAEQQVTRHSQPGLQDTVKTILQGKEFNKSKFL